VDKIDFIVTALNQLFPDPKPFLYHENSFTLLVAVLLSGNATDKMVNRVTPTLFAKANSPQKMAALSEATIRFIIRPCGLAPTKAKAIRALSQILVERYGGHVPSTFAELEALPHVGYKTAAVVLAQSFHIPTFPVDTHILRLAHRWKLSTKKSPTAVSKDLMRLFPKKYWTRLHLQMIEYGRAFCPARGHVVADCPICKRLCLTFFLV